MRSGLARKLDGALRLALAHGAGRLRGDILVNEFPRSGGSWIASMLGELLGYPFPANRPPAVRRCILHGHHLSPFGMPRVVVVWRDGRDVMVSWYFHCLFKNERENARLVDRARSDLPFSDYADIRSNLPAFVEYVFTRQAHPGFNWSDFVATWMEREEAVHVRYEHAWERTAEEMARIVRELTGRKLASRHVEEVVNRYSFARQSGRTPGSERRTSFMRKGIVGDWVNQFTREGREVFAHFAGEALIRAGYEADGSWVTRRVPGTAEEPQPGHEAEDPHL